MYMSNYNLNYNNLNWRFKPSFTETFSLITGLSLVFLYSWIMDDAYIYFRYIDNLVIHGHGLVWNRGEYVEGFSSPAWALLLGVLRAAHLDYWIIVRVVGLLCFTLFWYVACLVNRGLMPIGRQTTSYNVPLIYLSFTYAISSYFSSGLESPLVNIAAVTYAAGILWPQSLIFQSLIGLTPLIRHEFLLPFLLFLAWSFFFKKVRPIATVTVFILSVGFYEIFRVWYYADLLPNTFYLKDTTWFTQGLRFVYDALMPYFTVSYMAGMGLIYWILKKDGLSSLRRNDRLAMIVFSLPVAVYVIRIGGDPRHFRYLAFPYILCVLATGGLLERLVMTIPQSNTRYVTLFLILFGFSTILCYPRQLQQHPLFRSYAGYTHRHFLLINDAAAHRLNSIGITPSWYSVSSFLAYSKAKERFKIDSKSNKIADYSPIGKPPWRTATCHRSLTPLIADGWCQTAYLYPVFPVIHSLGLTEPFLARTQMHSNRPAHKLGLKPLAKDLLAIRCQYGFVQGAFDHAISNGHAPNWIINNIENLRKLEKKVYNKHDFINNIRVVPK